MMTSDDAIRACRSQMIDVENSVNELAYFSEIFSLLIDSIENRASQVRIDALSRVASDLWAECYPELADSSDSLKSLRSSLNSEITE